VRECVERRVYFCSFFLHACPPLHTRTIFQWEGLSEYDMGERMCGGESIYCLFCVCVCVCVCVIFFVECACILFFVWIHVCWGIKFHPYISFSNIQQLISFLWLEQINTFNTLNTSNTGITHISSSLDSQSSSP
jgi:hypothetical protein